MGEKQINTPKEFVEREIKELSRAGVVNCEGQIDVCQLFSFAGSRCGLGRPKDIVDVILFVFFESS